MSDWTCTCGRNLAAEKTKCPGCGLRKDELPAERTPATTSSSSGRVIGRRPGGTSSGRLAPVPAPVGAPTAPGSADPPILRSLLQPAMEPIAPLPSSVPPARLVTRTLQLELPRYCCCCLGGASGIKHSVQVGESGTFGVDVGSTFIGLTSLLVAGVGWIQFTDKDAFQSRLSLPICAACRHHSTARERASIISGAVGLGALFLSMAIIRPHNAKEGLTACGVGLAAFVIAVIVQAIVGKRPEPPCCGSRPVGLSMDGDDRFTITFGNPAFGHRVAALNPRVIE